ncbi:hypothetical protein SCHPADRAFT_1001190 [Schizopora paradoxa]|uniref:Uncharacterized protein n=1 Tax=Schizopora paradoxa TaxID=27342 RepID=A0A0H2R8D5_9AGAM|nr:hypothetical protein SCHPADRAFT_1001190 [Schizopora paradoxa]
MSRNASKRLRKDDRKLFSEERRKKEEKSRADVFASVTNWFDSDCKVALPTELKKDVDAVLSLRYAEILRNPGHRETIKHVADEVQSISSRVSSLASALQEKTNALLAILHKCGIALLPDEVLAAIFGFVIELTVPEDTKLTSHKWRAAVKLSHVSRRFRSVMLACPRFWTNMNSSRKMAAACLPRTKGLPLSVNLTIEVHDEKNEQTFEPILSELLPVREFWGRLHLNFNSTYSYKSHWRCEYDTLIKHMLYRMDAPMLQELSIEYKDYTYYRRRQLNWDWSQWKTPNLRRLEVKSYFPFSLPGLVNITSLDLSISVDDSQMARILKEISEISNLQDLAVELLNAKNYPFLVLEKLEFPRVQRLKIKTTLKLEATDGIMAIKRSIFSSLFFPNAIEIQLQIEGCDDKSGPGSYHEAEGAFILHFNKEICCIFRHIHQFPRLERLYLEISPWDDSERDCKVHAKLALPLNMLPNLKDLTLRCNTRFDISEPDVRDGIFYRQKPPRVVGNAFPALNTVTFDVDVREASSAARWLGEYLVEMRGRGKWDEFRELKVVERVGKDLKTTTFPGDDALQWCKNIIARNEAWGTSKSVLL